MKNVILIFSLILSTAVFAVNTERNKGENPATVENASVTESELQ